ncbi:MAG: beta strand repeat-containing protein [Myxococcota bacterium]
MPLVRPLSAVVLLLSATALAAAPTATTNAATSVTATTAQLNGAGNPGGEATLGWFRMSTTNPGACDDVFGTRVPAASGTSLGSGTANTTYSVSTTGLLPGTTYYFCAITNNASGTAFGGILTFTTPALAPAVTTLAATVVTSFGATLNGSAIPQGSAATGYFRYSTTSPGSCNNTFGTRVPSTGGTALGSGNTSTPYSEVLTGLQAGVTYYYCAIANNGIGTSYGNLLQFTTLVAVPSVTTSAPASVTGTSATLQGTVNPNGAATTGWFRLASSNPGSCNDAFGTRVPSSGGNNLGGGSTTVSHTWSTTLTPGTTYYYCAIAQNSEGTTLGNVVSFTTPDIPSVTTSAASSVLATSATLNGTGVPNLASATGWFRYSTSNPGTCNDSFGTRSPSSGGTNLGAGTTATPFTSNITGLLPGTTYFYCAIASNSVGTGYGALLTLNTPPTAPNVSTLAATAITGSTATLNGQADPRGDATTGYFRYATSSPGTCNDTFGTRVPATGGTNLGGGNGYVSYLENLTGLTPGTTYYFCALGVNGVGTSVGGVQSFTTPNVPTVTTVAASSIFGTGATLNASVNPNGASTTGYFRYSTTNPGTCDDTFGTRLPTSGGNNLGAGTGATSSPWSVSTLSPGTTYYFCALATNSVGTGFGAVLSFTTPAIPAMTTLAAAPVTATSATLNGSGNPNGASATGWFRYSTTNPMMCDDLFGTRVPSSGSTSLGSGTAPVAFNQPLSGLLPGTTYYYCAIGNNSVGTGFGLVQTFTTPPTAPIVTTNAVTLLTGTTVTLNGSANPRGATSTGWFRYATTNPGTCNDTFGTRAPTTGGTNLGSSNTTQSYAEPLTGLTPGTTYYYCALASNSEGTSVGGVGSFTTPATPDVTTEVVSALAGTSVTLNGTGDPNLGSATGWFRYATSNPGTCNDTFGTRAPATGGTSLGSGTSPVSYAQSVTGLTPGTTYYYCAVVQNLVGTGFGSILSFTTPAIPTVATTAVTSLTATSVSFNGTGTPNGASATGWFRYDTVNPGTCNDTFGTRSPSSGGSSLGSGAAPIAFTQSVTTLLPGTTYFVCAIASNSVGTGFGTPVTFTTPPTAPLVTTSSATSVTSSTATLNGSANPRGALTTGWFRYDTVNPGTCNDSFGFRVPFTMGTSLGSGNSAQSYSQSLTGLSLATTYYYCAIAQNSEGTSFGAVTSFTTSPTAPSVTTLAATSITTSAATLNASVTPNGAATTAWVRYSTTNPGTCSDTFGTRAPISGGTTLGGGTSAVPFSITPTTLTPGATYYYCAIAQNSVGLGFGAVLSFTTQATPPTVNTLAATSIGGSSATLNASVTPNGDATTTWFRYSTSNPGACNDAFGTKSPATGTTIGSGTSAVAVSEPLTGLTPGATYYFCAIAQNSLGTVFGLVLNFSTPQAPTVTTNAASPVTATSATLNAVGVANGTAATGWFRFDTTDPGTCNDTFGTRTPATGGTALGSGSTSVSYAQALSGLLPGTTYFFCALASNLVGTSYGAVLSFTTPPAAPSVAAVPASNIAATTATFNANVNPNGSATTVYFRYSTTNPGTCNDTFGTRSPASGGTSLPAPTVVTPVVQNVTGLTPGATYYFCPIAVNGVGTTFGGVQSFTTLAAPTVTTTAATGIASTTATLNGSAIPNRDATTAYFRYSTTNPGTCDDAFGTRAPATGGTSLGSGTVAVSFTQALTGLMQGTTYYYCAIGQNSVGTSFGAVLTFTTTNAPSPTTLAATSVTGTTATLNGSANPNGATATGWFRYATSSPGTCNDTFGTRTPTTGGTALGAGTSPVSYTRSLTGLVAGTTYYYCAIASNAAGTGVGNVMSFTTPGAPSVTTSAASAVTTTSATLEGAANPNLGAATGWFRYSTSSPGTCNDTFGTRAPATGGTSLGSGSTVVPFTQAITGLAQATTYYVCAIASNTQGTRFGTVVSFTTQSAPTVSSSAATTVGSTTATLNGNVNPRGAATTGWFRYATSSPGTCNDTFGTRIPATGGIDLGSGTSTTPMNQPLTGLTPGTRYYFCALAQNANGTDTGGVLNFTTTDAPAAVTNAATSVLASSATLNGSGNPNGDAATGWFRYSTTNPGTCNDAFGTRAPATGGTALGSGTAAVAYTTALTGLASSTTYFFCAIVQNGVGTSFGSVLSFTTPAAPNVTTTAATSVTSTTASLNGTTNPNGAAATAWFRYATTNPGTCSDTFGTRAPSTGGVALGSGTTDVAHTQAISGLASGTTYYYCAIASNSAGTAYGAVLSFTTPGAPVTTTTAATAITASSVTLNGTVNAAGNSTTAYFRYSTTSPGTCNTTFGTRAPATGGTAVPAGFTVTPFSENVSGLAAATTYYYCAIATNASGTTFGAVLSFTTAAGPSVATSPASAVTSTSATLNGSANPRGLAATGWFRYATSNPGACNDAFGTRAPATGGTSLGAGTSAVGFVENLTGLTPGTTYYFCAIAQNAAGTSTGTVEVFTTPGPPTVTTSAATAVSSTGATLNATGVPNLATTTGWFRYSATNPGTCDDVFGTRAPASGGTALGAGTSATPFSQALTGLTAGTTYYFCALASNANGTRVGSVLSFTTPAAPTVTTVAASGVTGTQATLNGTANPNASAATGWFRYATTNPTTCNDTFGTRTPTTGGTALGSGTTAAPFTATLTGLTPGATYWFCAIASNAIGTAFGAPQSFTVPAAGPAVTTTAATFVTGVSAQLNGSGNPGGAATTGWFRYATTNPGTCNDTFGTRAPATGGANLGSGTTSTTFSQAVSGLMPGTTYYFCAVAQNSVGTGVGTVQSFSTPGLPTVATSLPSTVTGTSATLSGQVNPNGAATTGWFRYATTDPGTCNDTFGTRAPTSGGSALGAGMTAVALTQTAFGLTPGTTYYVCAIASNVVGTAFGAVQTFRTPAAPIVVTSSASNLVGLTATLNGQANPNGAATTAWFRFSTTNPGTCNDTFGTRAPATGGSNVGSGQTSLGYSQGITGLQPGGRYYFCAIASNSVGTSFGTVETFDIEAPPPTVTTISAGDVAQRGATLNALANPRGTAATGWFRYSTTEPVMCDDTFGTRVPESGGMALGMGNVDAPYSVAVDGLKPGTKYWFCAIASNLGGAGFGAVQSFTTLVTQPTVRTGPATVMGNDVTLTGTANTAGMTGKAWFQVATDRPIICTASSGQKLPPEGLSLSDSEADAPVSHPISSSPGTYYYCAAVETGGGTVFGEVQSFTIAEEKAQGCTCSTGGELGLFALGVLFLRRRRAS